MTPTLIIHHTPVPVEWMDIYSPDHGLIPRLGLVPAVDLLTVDAFHRSKWNGRDPYKCAGYTAGIAPSGLVQPGRVSPPWAHCRGYNRVPGLALLGYWDADHQPPEQQLHAAAQWVACYLAINGGETRAVLGHGEVPGQRTDCPGIDMDRFRAMVARYRGAP